MAREPARTRRLDVPQEHRPLVRMPAYDPETFGQWAERFARFMGTARFLVYMTGFVIVWIAINVIGLFGLRWDPYPFILLNLIFSTQASYAAPLILLAQNRQDDRDRVALEEDRARNDRNIADTEYLTREIAALRLAVGEVATRDFVRGELTRVVEELAERVGLDTGGNGRAGTDSPPARLAPEGSYEGMLHPRGRAADA